MADTTVKTAKTIEQALQAALEELGVSEDCVDYEILERPSKGFFGILGGKPARIRVTVKERKQEEVSESAPAEEALPEKEEISQNQEDKNLFEPSPEEPISPSREEALKRAEDFLQNVFQAMHMEVGIQSKAIEEGYVLNLTGKGLGILIGKHGQTMNALQYLLNLSANRNVSEHRLRFIIDVENYRERREETLRKLANRLADRAVRIRQAIKLEPMNRHERKVIHMALQDQNQVTTYSDGEEPHRYVVIVPAKHKNH